MDYGVLIHFHSLFLSSCTLVYFVAEAKTTAQSFQGLPEEVYHQEHVLCN